MPSVDVYKIEHSISDFMDWSVSPYVPVRTALIVTRARESVPARQVGKALVAPRVALQVSGARAVTTSVTVRTEPRVTRSRAGVTVPQDGPASSVKNVSILLHCLLKS